MILLVLLISCCSKTDRDEAKLQYNAQASNSNRQAVIGDLYYLASLAKDFYKKPINNNGGGNSWSSNVDNVGNWLGFEYNTSTKKLSSENGTFELSINRDVLTIVGTGTEKGGDSTNNVKATITIKGATSRPEIKVNN